MSEQIELSGMAIQSTVASPVDRGERIAAVDVLRGVAVLGILVINIEFFALPHVIFYNPSLVGGFAGLNLLTYKFASVLFLQKMMAIFSMLFGAGLVLMYERFEKSGRRFGKVHYRRVLWLLLIALVHGYLLWYGDILFNYAMIGLLLFLFRRRTARTLIIIGISVLLVGMAIQYGAGFQFKMLKSAVVEVETARAEGRTPAQYHVQMAEAWDQIKVMMEPSEEEIASEYEAYRGGYMDNLSHRAPMTMIMQSQAFLFFLLWRAGGLMLLGMGLMKLGVFSAKRTTRFYIILTLSGYAIGLPLSIHGTNAMIAHDFDLVHHFMVGGQFHYVGSVLVALGHVGVVMLLCKLGVLAFLKRCLAAVGQTALTNYLTQTLICTTIFYGYGLGLFGSIGRFHLLWFVLGIWILQLIISPLWMKRFRFGPAEWVWRSLTYWKLQPMRIARSD